MTRPYTHVSLFSGVGGFDRGFEQHGFDSIGQCEIDTHARKVLEAQWPDVPKHDDVQTLQTYTFGYPDVVSWGSPCQGLSVAGRRKGLADERSGLFSEAVRYIKDLLEETDGEYPRLAVWENVPGSLTSNKGEDFRVVLQSLVGGDVPRPDKWRSGGVVFGPEGSAEWRVLDSQHFGLAQRRKRIFLVFHPSGERAGHILFEREGLPGDPRTSDAAEKDPARHAPEGAGERGGVLSDGGITQALTSSFGTGGPDAAHAQAGWLVPDRKPTQVPPPLGFNWQNWTNDGLAITEDATGPLVRSQVKAVAFATRGREEGNVPEVHGDGQTVSTIQGASGGSSRDYLAYVKARRAKDKDDFETWKEGVVNPTLNAFDMSDTRATTVIPLEYGVRRLTPVECERLQGFPDEHTKYDPDGKEIAKTHRYKLMGNAVSVPVTAWIAKAMAAEMAAQHEELEMAA